MKEYQVYLFDMDGTLVNSEPLKGKAIALACEEYGASVDFNIYKDVMGEHWSIVTRYFFKHAKISPDPNEFNQFFRAHYEILLSENLELNKGARAYLRHLKATGKKCGLVSSASTWMINNILTALELDNVFDVVVAKEHVTKHKPDPEAYNLALAKLNVTPEQALIFEDSNAGVSAGIASGCEVIAIRHDFNDKNDFSNAVACIDNFEDISI